jgi:hypothetical protein
MLLIQEKVKMVSETVTKMGWMIWSEEKRPVARGGPRRGERGRLHEVAEGGGGPTMEFAQKRRTATLWPPDGRYSVLQGLLRPPDTTLAKKKQDPEREGRTLKR